MLFCLSVFQQRRAGEADEHRARQDLLHRLVQLAGLCAVALVHEDEEIAFGFEVRRQSLLHLLDVTPMSPRPRLFLAAELVDQRANQPRLGLVQRADQVRAALGAVNVLVHAL